MNNYCTQIGMIVEFSYCISMNEGFPCRNSIGCWEKRIDITKILLGKLGEEGFRNIFGGLPKSRIEQIVNAIKTAKDEE